MTTTNSVLDQLKTVLAQLIEVRHARAWGVRECARQLGAEWPRPSRETTTLRLLDAYARQFGHAIRLLLVADDPAARPVPWRQRMPHGDNPDDGDAMTEVWRLQQRLHRIRSKSGQHRDDLAKVLGIPTLELWRLENSPAAADPVLIHVMLLARFFGHTLRLHLDPIGDGEVTDLGTWTDNGSDPEMTLANLGATPAATTPDLAHKQDAPDWDAVDLVQRYRDGDTVEELAQQYPLTFEQVRDVLIRAGINTGARRTPLPRTPPGLVNDYDDGRTMQQLATTYGMSRQVIRRILLAERVELASWR